MPRFFSSRRSRVDPNYGQAEAALGQAYWLRYQTQGKQSQWIAPAQQACAKAVELGNAGADGHICLGLIFNGTGQYEKAADEFQKAMQLDPTRDQAYSGLGRVYQKLNQPEKAEEVYQRAINLRPQYWLVYNQLGALYISEAEYDRAATMFRRAAELDPDSYAAFSNLGAALVYAGKDQDAAQALEKSLALRPSRDAYNNIAVAQFRLRRFQDSVKNFKEALKLEDTDYQTWGNLGASYYYGGDTASALDTYRKAISMAEQQLKINPRDPIVLGDLASYHAMLGHREQALRYLDQSLALGHGDKELLLNAAVVYNQLRQTGPALEWLGKALAAGYSRSVVATSAALSNLHENPQYRALMQQE